MIVVSQHLENMHWLIYIRFPDLVGGGGRRKEEQNQNWRKVKEKYKKKNDKNERNYETKTYWQKEDLSLKG